MADSTPALCGDCNNPVKGTPRGAHSACFPETRQPETDPARCGVIEDGERCTRPGVIGKPGKWCNRHYVRWTRTGSPLKVRAQIACTDPCAAPADDGDGLCGGDFFSRRDGMPYCRAHYHRLYRNGTFALTRRRFTYTGDDVADFWRLVDTCGGDADRCWTWQGSVTVQNYGSWMHSPAHRYAYRLHHGEIPDGTVIDHTCHDPRTCEGTNDCPHRLCVNPVHLAAVPSRQNTSAERSSRHRSTGGTCGVPGCDKPFLASAVGMRLCSGHYQRARHHGHVFADIPLGKGGKSLADR